MKAITKFIAAGVLLTASAQTVSAQYYQLVNQATDMIGTAIRGGANYRGFFDVSYVRGIGDKKANFLEFSTTQGLKYGNLFFMGVGAGVDLMHTEVNTTAWSPTNHNTTRNAVMIPLYTDFRLNTGSPATASFFLDVKVGGGFFVSNDYILVGDGYINSSSSFYLKPTVGLRIPVSKTNPKLAVNVGGSYQLITNSYWYNPGQNNSVTLSALGLNIGFEW